MVHGAIQYNQLTFATEVKSSPYEDRPTDITICTLHTGINMLLNLPPTYPSSPIYVMQIDS